VQIFTAQKAYFIKIARHLNKVMIVKPSYLIFTSKIVDNIFNTSVFNLGGRIFNDLRVETHHDNGLHHIVSLSLNSGGDRRATLH